MQNKRIIFVDDDQFTAAMSCEALRDHGYSVLELHSAAEALGAIDAHEPLFALVTDINLGPGIDGFEIARYARAAYSDLPVVYISGLNALRHAGEGVSGSAFIPKPYDVAGIIVALASPAGQDDFDPAAPPRGAGGSAQRPGVSFDGLGRNAPILPPDESRDNLARIDSARRLASSRRSPSCYTGRSGPASSQNPLQVAGLSDGSVASAPVHRRSARGAAQASIRERSRSDAFTADGRSLCILHVDDHPVNRRVVAEVLSALGHRSVEAACGAEALDQLRLQAFDLVLMDINMPGMSGIEVTRQLRNFRGAGRDTPVIALTSEVERSTADYLALGFDDYVAKPFHIQILAQAIETCGYTGNRKGRTDRAKLLAG
ncbi:response regulator [Phenylobacterium sp.]|uniref:response regulator n=1 Tax=Phenylobacterium sp. TaxID=1871053 RepID=UPI002E32B507|nr:response regulator [Phenylobacterium sp.]HEX3366396.1 response regulator [Phenylobacterium sp.]